MEVFSSATAIVNGGFRITDLVEVVAGFAIALTHVASASPTPPPPCAPSPPCAQSWFAPSTAATPLQRLHCTTCSLHCSGSTPTAALAFLCASKLVEVQLREEREEGVAGREGGRSCGKRERKELREEREEGVAGREKGRSCGKRERKELREERKEGVAGREREIETLN
ncbi:hypothetical protein DEO72_LG8g2573 [Vigna unguiculata]|uniref:Uncharacterized protein n=1 Tax=Vigna unguiculata TaxID=3917 RepID=A0A4D6MXD6_VIGUN|nr:hypothetical protein DEO72_LG8g2573 [Vigna unguiculata]